MKLPRFQWQALVLVVIVGGIVALGIWAFGVDKPTRITLVQIALRHVEEQRAELGVLETDHRGVEHFFEADGADLDYSLVDRPRSIYTEPVTLSNDRDNAPSKVRITMRGVSDSEVRLGLRMMRPNRTWDSTRFTRSKPISMDELQSEDWFYLAPLPVKITYHQPLVDAVRVFIYIAVAFAVIMGLSWIVWRRWMS